MGGDCLPQNCLGQNEKPGDLQFKCSGFARACQLTAEVLAGEDHLRQNFAS
ncbi:hypothetical protein RchiOBHm_Chr3g0472111 [Rosa chinensis]|uniref:Uncharacterized protein n=1 Tax=Rosa chinensis TaxID=74649 RepID=A0A2P6RBI0_ROSCH|nr:hypothetical protein RchiOBHm_Chr3g0472111 [Rosa chinensis]